MRSSTGGPAAYPSKVSRLQAMGLPVPGPGGGGSAGRASTVGGLGGAISESMPHFSRSPSGSERGMGTSRRSGENAVLLTFIDQPGHEKYLKTTLSGMTGTAMDYAMLVVSGVMGVQRMTREHLAIALALQVPLFVVITKSDVAGGPTGGPGNINNNGDTVTASPVGQGRRQTTLPPSAQTQAAAEAHPLPQNISSRNDGNGGNSRRSSSGGGGKGSGDAVSGGEGGMERTIRALERVLRACTGRKATVIQGVGAATRAAKAFGG
ncbi:unnamed protein product [Discosporangium mesarthrocarpum]